MKRGRVAEVGSPWELLEKRGLFFRMVENTGKNAEVIRNKAAKVNRQKLDE